eukprot:jgi/Botrbrau1/5284/Bobra.0391s0005.1
MLKSLKQKYGSRKGNSTANPGAEQSTVPALRNATSTNSRAGTSAGSAALGRVPSTQPSKLPLPTLSEESLQAAYAEPLPHFKDLAAADKQALFVKKLHLCAFTFDFSDQSKHGREKEIKRQTLLEVVDYVNTGKFNEAVSEDIIFMVSNNLFRALPPSKSHDADNLDPDEEEPTLEPAWPHLQIVYEFLLRYVVQTTQTPRQQSGISITTL